MELIFRRNPNTGSWVAEFEATADVALHIEGVDEGTVMIFQRGTASGQYALTKDGTPAVSYGKVYDYEIPILIAPKFIKVVCRTEPTYAEVVSNGEITELKYQEKSVEVTANGNTEVIPDAGFMGLTKVNVSVNVPQSGGGESGGGSSWRYFDTRNMREIPPLSWCMFLSIFHLINRVGEENRVFIETAGGLLIDGIDTDFSKIKGLAIDSNAPYMDSTHFESIVTAWEALEFLCQNLGTSSAEETISMLNITEITEEEFYNLNA